MHRSGTSAMAGVLQRLGFEAGNNLIEPAFDNSRGFYEDADVVQVNEDLLKSLGLDWTYRGVIEHGDWSNEDISELRERVSLILRRYQREGKKCFIKDPRLCFTLPLWIDCAKELDFKTRAIIMLRDERSIASSLHKRNGISKPNALDLIQGYYLSAVRNSSVITSNFILYSELTAYPELVIDKLIRNNDEYTDREVDLSAIKEYLSVPSSKPDVRSEVQLPLKDILSLDSTVRQVQNDKLAESISLHKHRFGLNSNSCIELPSLVKLLVDSGSGFMDISELGDIVLKDGIRKFSVQKKVTLSSISSIRIVFPDSVERINISHLDFHCNSRKLDYQIVTTGRAEGTSLLFDDGSPLLNVDFDRDEKITSVDISIGFQLDSDDNFQKQITKHQYGIGPALLAALKNPLRLIRNLNGKNFRTLRRALGRERPQYILRNFIKLLTDKNQLDTLSSRSRKVPERSHTLSNHLASVNRLSNKDSRYLKKVAYVMDRIPRSDTSSGDRRVTHILKLISSISKLSLFVSDYNRDDIYAIELTKFLEIRQIGKSKCDSDLVIYNTYKSFVDYGSKLSISKPVLQIIDTVDVHWVREERALDHWEALDESIVARNKAVELESYGSVDLLWTVSDHDKTVLSKLLPDIECRTVSNIHTDTSVSGPNLLSKNLLFIGDFAHHPNRSTLKLIVKDALPQIVNEIPDVKLIVVGANSDSEILELSKHSNIDFKGYVTDEELDEIYGSVFITLAPMVSGSGVKGKITEAILRKIPVATNSIGNEGIGLVDGESGIVEDDVVLFSQKVISLLKKPDGLVDMTELAYNSLNRKFSPDAALKSIRDSIYKRVAICIPTHNKLAYLRPCIDSILAYTQYPNYTIFVYSNACTDGTIEYLKNLVEEREILVNYIISQINQVFVKPCNEMIRRSDNSDVVLLNNDTIIHNGWLSELSKLAYSSQDIGVVGSKVLNENGSLQEFGSIIYEDGSGLNVGKNDDASSLSYAQNTRAAYVSGCSMYIKRSTINSVGLFDEIFSPAYFEDSDYCYRVWQQGLEVWVSSRSIVTHKEGGTAGKDS